MNEGTAAESPVEVADAVWTPEEAAAYLRVTPSSVLAEAEAGRLPGRRIAGRWRFSALKLSEWIDSPVPVTQSDRKKLLSLAGIWKDDPFAEQLIARIQRERWWARLRGRFWWLPFSILFLGR